MLLQPPMRRRQASVDAPAGSAGLLARGLLQGSKPHRYLQAPSGSAGLLGTWPSQEEASALACCCGFLASSEVASLSAIFRLLQAPALRLETTLQEIWFVYIYLLT